MTWKYKKGDIVYVSLKAKILEEWGPDDLPPRSAQCLREHSPYQFEIEIPEGTQNGTRIIKIDVSEAWLEVLK